MMNTKRNKKKKINKNAIFWVAQKIRKRIPALCLLTGASMLEGFLGVLFALGTRNVIDSASQGDSQALLYAGLWLGLLILGMIFCSALSRHLHDKLDADLDRDLKKTFMHYILYGDYAELSRYPSGDLVHRLNADIQTVSTTLMVMFPSLASLVVRSISVVLVLSTVSPVFTMVLLLLCLLVGAGMLSLQRLLKKLNKKINDSSGKISGFLQEKIEKLLIIQALNVAEYVEKETEKLLENRWQLQKKRKNIGIFTSTGISFLGYIIGFITLIWCACQMMMGQMTFGMLTAVTQLSDQLEYPIYMLPQLVRQFISMSASAERLMELEQIPQHEDSSHRDLSPVYADLQAITGDRLTFSYDRSPVFQNVSFRIPKNKLTVIVGSSGIGKSTLLKLLLGIYEVQEGQLSLALENNALGISKQTRNLFSYAPQGNLIFSGTLRENLTIVHPDADEAAIREAVYVSAMDDYLPTLPDGLDTLIGENGIGLSEGQIQRLSLARAVLSPAPILLLDEVTSALDTETEQKVLRRIRQLKDRTCIAVTHRPAVLDLADWKLDIRPEKILCQEMK